MSCTTSCKEILDLFAAAGKPVPTEDSDMGRAVQILQEICDRHSHTIYTPEEMDTAEDVEASTWDIFAALEELESNIGTDDFTLDFDGNEYRLIEEDAIWNIYVEEIKEMVTDGYDLKLDELPSFIAVSIDWEETANNAYADGYGHQFRGYDGSEYEAAGYSIFRAN